MDAARFDQMPRHLSRRGLTAVAMAALTTARRSSTESEARPRDVCGGAPSSLSRYCAGVRTCTTDSNCAPSCACIARRAGCCYTMRRKKKAERRSGNALIWRQRCSAPRANLRPESGSFVTAMNQKPRLRRGQVHRVNEMLRGLGMPSSGTAAQIL